MGIKFESGFIDARKQYYHQLLIGNRYLDVPTDRLHQVRPTVSDRWAMEQHAVELP
jgi:hypothetical protein